MIKTTALRERVWTVRAPGHRRDFTHVVARGDVLYIRRDRSPFPLAAWRVEQGSGALRRVWALEDEPPAASWRSRRKAA
ncbi:hypothetical protein [Caulobacter mirabilis]|uniref:Uncharacterized protein n=1 Tax=Caulobacter mirabilis TaxID=69666 RepID=A0A2D2B085_9CAUL|nr:hypothetical protein [Caulobacter mirabilis]ATQ43665.1 hypothetical protein CSW64_15320 [Caulobacter mirabilis]